MSDAVLLRETRRIDLKREQCIAVAMGLALLLSCAGLLFKAFRKFKMWDKWSADHVNQDKEIETVTDIIAWTGFACIGFQAALRFWVGRKIRIRLVWHAFGVSVVTLLFFLVLAVAASFEREWSWKAEPIAACVLVAFMLIEGVRIVILNLGDVELQLRTHTRL